MTTALSTAVEIIKGISVWEWLALGYVLSVGIQATKRRTVLFPVLVAFPLLFVLFRHDLFQSNDLLLAGAYFGSLCAGGIFGYLQGREGNVVVNKKQGTVETPGDQYLITLPPLLFAAKYAFLFWLATVPAMAAMVFLLDRLVSGVLTGVLLGRSFSFARRFNNA